MTDLEVVPVILYDDGSWVFGGDYYDSYPNAYMVVSYNPFTNHGIYASYKEAEDAALLIA